MREVKRFLILAAFFMICLGASGQTGSWQWAVSAGGTYAEEAKSIVTDASGNSYIIGYFVGTINFGSLTLTSSGSYQDIFVAKLSSAGTWVWARRAGGAGDDVGQSIALDPTGANVYVTGQFNSSTATFGSITLTRSGSSADIFVAKLSSSGSWLWAKRAGSTSPDAGTAVICDDASGVYIAGTYMGTATFGTFSLANTDIDSYVAKLDSSGNWLWAVRITGAAQEMAYALSVDSNNYVYVAGSYTSSTAIFGSLQLSNSGADDIFVAKISPDGTWQWARKAGGAGSEFGMGMCTDAAGSSYLTGYYTSSLNFGSTTLTPYGSNDIFVAKIDALGNWLWAKRAGSTSFDVGWGVASDNWGNVYVSGEFRGTAFFGSTSLYNSSSSVSDAFIAKLDSAGNWLGATKTGSTGKDIGRNLSTDPAANVYWYGLYTGSAVIGQTTLTSVSGSQDLFVGKLQTTPLHLVCPDGGEAWEVGSTQQITWTSVNLTGLVKLTLHQGSDSEPYLILSEEEPVSAGAFTWEIPLDLPPDNNYRVRIESLGDELVTDASDAFFSVTAIVVTPGAPLATQATNITSTSFQANWEAVDGADGYRLDVSLESDFSTMLTGYADLPVNTLHYDVTGLQADTEYFYRVRAYNAAGVSPNSNVITVSTLIPIPPAPVATFATNIGTSGFQANWEAAAGATGYRFDLSTSFSFGSYVGAYQNLAVSGTFVAVTGLNSGTTYYYRIRANNASGTSENSNTVSALTIPAAPVATAATEIGLTGFKANWNPATGASSYLFDLSGSETFSSFIDGYAALQVSGTNLTPTGLQPGTGYYYRVRAVNTSGASANSNFIGLTTNSPLPPVASFVAAPLSGVAPLSVQLTDQSTPGSGTITTWDWDFGDGGNSTLSNPQHLYSEAGSYDVTLTVTNSWGLSNSLTRSAYISVQAAIPELNLLTPDSIDFGDVYLGASSPQQTVTVQNTGNAVVTLTLIALHGGDQGFFVSPPERELQLNPGETFSVGVWFTPPGLGEFTDELRIENNSLNNPEVCVSLTGRGEELLIPPTALFHAEPTSGLLPLAVQFNDLSEVGSAPIVEWHWDFGDGAFSSEQNPEHVFTQPGVWTVTLTVSDAREQSDTLIRNDYIHAMAPSGLLNLLSGSQLSFGEQYLDMASAYRPVRIFNSGNRAINISEIALNSPLCHFDLLLPDDWEILAPGETDSLLVRFIPHAPGQLQDYLTVSNDSDNQPLLQIHLSGIGMLVPPRAPQNLSIARDQANIHLAWDQVVENIFGEPITPEFYLVFISSTGDTPGSFLFHSLVYDCAFNHLYAAAVAQRVFYRVYAVELQVGGDAESCGEFPDLRQGMTESEVFLLLNDFIVSNFSDLGL